jgi:hypothetical protein
MAVKLYLFNNGMPECFNVLLRQLPISVESTDISKQKAYPVFIHLIDNHLPAIKYEFILTYVTIQIHN